MNLLRLQTQKAVKRVEMGLWMLSAGLALVAAHQFSWADCVTPCGNTGTYPGCANPSWGTTFQTCCTIPGSGGLTGDCCQFTGSNWSCPGGISGTWKVWTGESFGSQCVNGVTCS